MSWPVPGVTGTTMVTVRPAGWAWPGDGQSVGPSAATSNSRKLTATRNGIEHLRTDAQVYTYRRRLWHARQRCPVSDARDAFQHPLTRASETKGHREYMVLVPLIDRKFLNAFAAGGAGTSNRRH